MKQNFNGTNNLSRRGNEAEVTTLFSTRFFQAAFVQH